MGCWIRFWKTRNWADAIFNQFSHNFLQDPRLLIFDFGRYLTISVFITQKSKYIKYSGKIRLRINFEVEHIYWLLTRSDFLRVQKQAWSSKNPFSLRNRMAVKRQHFWRFFYEFLRFLLRLWCKRHIFFIKNSFLKKFWERAHFRARRALHLISLWKLKNHGFFAQVVEYSTGARTEVRARQQFF